MKLSEIYGFTPQVFIGDNFGRWQDLFGIELELEELSRVTSTAYWDCKGDASLREGGAEYILRQPLGGSLLNAAVEAYYGFNLEYTNGPRTSTHIHVTAGDMTVDNLRAMIVMMYTIEDALFDVIGENRKWAGYAVPLSEMNPKRLQSILSSNNNNELATNISPNRNQERYYGLNICCNKHGTMEFRYFPGGPSKEELHSWLDLVAAIKSASLRTSLATLVNIGNNRYELEMFLRSVLPDFWWQKLSNVRSLDFMLEKYNEVVAFCVDPEGVTRTQQLVFATAPLVNFVRSKLLKDAGRAVFDQTIGMYPVMGINDWSMYFTEAIEADVSADYRRRVAEGASRVPEPPPVEVGYENQWQITMDEMAEPYSADGPINDINLVGTGTSGVSVGEVFQWDRTRHSNSPVSTAAQILADISTRPSPRPQRSSRRSSGITQLAEPVTRPATFRSFSATTQGQSR